MASVLHGSARTTPCLRAEFQASKESTRALAAQNVARGDGEMAEVTSLEGAVRAWLELDPEHRTAALLTPERPVQIDGVAMASFEGDAITILSERPP